MSDIIRLLPDSVANQIAAGEVIQRPSSVVKELIENSVDAGSTEIKLIIRDAGKTLIQVSDNGSGMSDTDARMAFERHATSKIKAADDLFNLHSMGFRGEALPSICAISEVEVKTRKRENALGTHLVIEGTKVISQEPCACEPGTVISVKRLFYNVPARRKFLKNDSVELSNIMREFERLALVNHNLRMSIDTGNRIMDLRPGTLRQRIDDIWKNVLNSNQLLPVELSTSMVKIEGYISRPEHSRRRNPLQYMIVNGRNMRHPYFHKSIMSCYEPLIAQGTQPSYFLVFSVDPKTIDVNIHPTKNEIKFENEQEIWPMLAAAVKTTLGKFSAVPSIDFSVEAINMQPTVNPDGPQPPKVDYNPEYNPFDRINSAGKIKPAYRPTHIDSDWQSLYDNFYNSARKDTRVTKEGELSLTDEGNMQASEATPLCVQYALKYIITTSSEGLLIIDQYRAHLKILYEDYLSRTNRMDMVGQTMMFPEIISLDAAQQAALSEIEPELNRLGFILEYISDCEWKVKSVPSLLKPHAIKDTILRILDSISEESGNYGKDAPGVFSLRERMALIMAASGAIRRGVKLSQKEMENIISRLFSLQEPSLSPNGKKIFTVLTDSDIAGKLN